MSVERELLWKAYPDGILIAPGVGTMGGWRCVEVMPFGSVWCGRQVDDYRFAILGGDAHKDTDGLYERRADWRLGMDTFRASIDLGDLLPSLDPLADPATWACAKADLAQALGEPKGIVDRRWFGRYNSPSHDTRWAMAGFRATGHVWTSVEMCFDEPTEGWEMLTDPVTALAMARARRREGEK